jgi:hypothetical protein
VSTLPHGIRKNEKAVAEKLRENVSGSQKAHENTPEMSLMLGVTMLLNGNSSGAKVSLTRPSKAVSGTVSKENF